LFQQTNGGALFLDEIAEFSPALHDKFLGLFQGANSLSLSFWHALCFSLAVWNRSTLER
jgi:hypothetical protein